MLNALYAGRLLVLAVSLIALGCNSELKTYPVEGELIYSDTGEPVRHPLTIWFESTTAPYQRSMGLVKEGKFVLGTTREANGSIAGEHRVRIDPFVPNGAATEPAAKALARIMDPKYLEFRTSGIVVNVQTNRGNSVTIKVDPPPGGRKQPLPVE